MTNQNPKIKTTDFRQQTTDYPQDPYGPITDNRLLITDYQYFVYFVT